MRASGEARKAIALATSNGSTTPPSGVIALILASSSTPLATASSRIAVRTQVGATALTRMPWAAHSTASERVSASMPLLAAQ